MGFVYSIKVSDDFPHFKSLPQEEQAFIECNIVRVINDSYIVTGDEDYLIARFLAQKGLYRAFFWSALQAIEKYLKAFLLMNGIAINTDKFNSHKLFPLLTEAKKIDPTLGTINLDPHPIINIEVSLKKYLRKLNVHKFIEIIQANGHSSNRYNQEGVDFNSAYIFALDNFLFALRSRIRVPNIHDNFKKFDDDLMCAFKINNPLFNDQKKAVLHDVPSREFPINLGMTSTWLDYLKKIE